ncbi:hypothetical protein [Actinoplanes sp. G11-F43]|uniref:hypothetical protein n=1 Tax=Actinoplanes sp. G11-F43 TaxID=3424130 RepID=UPI003D34EFCC
MSDEVTTVKPQRRWIGLVAAVAVAVAAGIAAVLTVDTESAPAGPSDAGSRASAIQERWADLEKHRKQMLTDLVAKRSAALLAGDEAAWLADIDPARAETVAFERTRFQNLRQLNPAFYRIIDQSSLVGGHDPAPLQTTALVKQVLRLPEDVRNSHNEYQWELTVHDDRLVIGKVTERVLPVGHDPARRPAWDQTDLRSARGDGAVVLSARDSAWDPQTYLAAAERAAKLVRTYWGKRKGATGFVVFLVDDEQFRGWFDNDGVPMGGTTGVALFPKMVDDEGVRYPTRPDTTLGLGATKKPRYLDRTAGTRILLRMSKIKTMKYAEAVMAHEMAHALGPHLINGSSTDFSGDGATDQPSWAIEGFARYVEHKTEPGSAVKGAGFVRRNLRKYLPANGSFPTNANFYADDASRTTFNYEIGAAFFLAAERAGNPQKAADLYVALTNNSQLSSGLTVFIDQDMKAAGLNPDRVWAEFRKLVN